MQKSALQYGKIIFQLKVIPLFLPKILSSIHSIYGILYTLYGSECREEKKKAKYGEMRWTPKQ